MELILAGICVLAALASNYIYIVFGLHTKLQNLPGSDFYLSSTQVIVKKYPINIYPARPLVAIAWPGILLLSLAAAVTLFCACFNGKKFFDRKTYLFWIVQMFATASWTYTFDRELQFRSFCVLIVVILSYTATVGSAIKLVQTNCLKSISDSSRWWFNAIVMSYFGVAGSWIFVTLAATFNYAIAYQDSASFAQAKLTHYCNLDTCGVISLLLVIILQIIWTFFDLYIFPSYFAAIKTFYPSLSFFMFGIFLSNYQFNQGLTLSNWTSVFISATALLTWIYRTKLRQFFGNNRTTQQTNSNGKADKKML